MTPCMMDDFLSILQTLYMAVFVFVSNFFVCVNCVLVRLCLSAHSVPFCLCVSFYLPSVFLPCLPTVSDYISLCPLCLCCLCPLSVFVSTLVGVCAHSASVRSVYSWCFCPFYFTPAELFSSRIARHGDNRLVFFFG